MSCKKTILAVALAATLGTSSAYAAYALPTAAPAPAEYGNWYVNVFGGVGFTPDVGISNTLGGGTITTSTAGYDVGGGFGYRMGPFRYELQYMFMSTSNNGAFIGSTQAHAGMANVFYGFEGMSTRFVPYIGGGIGFAHVRSSAFAPTQSDNVFAYQVGGGFRFNVDDNFDVDLGYRYFGTSTPNMFRSAYSNHLVNLGVTYHIA